MPALLIVRLGRMPFGEALELQRAAAAARISGAIRDDLLLLVEHPPVVTLGRSARRENLLAPEAALAACGVELFEVERGGDVTFHGPGQLVGYAIVDLKRHRQDLHWYLRQVEQSLIVALAELGVAGEQRAGFTGVWTPGRLMAAGADAHTAETARRKIASIGVHARDWVTWHGFALNVTTDLSYFDLIVPCGIDAVAMTSVADELRRGGLPASEPLAAQTRAAVASAMAELFALEPVTLDLAELERVAATTIPA